MEVGSRQQGTVLNGARRVSLVLQRSLKGLREQSAGVGHSRQLGTASAKVLG